jgi:hypothetical protein
MKRLVFTCCLLGLTSIAEAQTTDNSLKPIRDYHSFDASSLPNLEEPKNLSAAYYWYGTSAIFGVVSGVTGLLYLSTIAELRELSTNSTNQIPDEILSAQALDLKNKSKKLALASGLSLSFAVGGALGGAFWTNHQAKLILAPSPYKTSLKLKLAF